MKRLHLITCLLFFLCLIQHTQAQTKRWSFSVGVARAGYNMEKLSQEQLVLQAEIPFSTRIVQDYPAHYNLRAQAELLFNKKNSLGVFAESMSTGGRITYSDYSGSFYLDQLVSAVQFGALYHHNLYQKNKIRALAGIRSGVFFTKHAVESRLKIFDAYTREEMKLSSFGVGAEPSL